MTNLRSLPVPFRISMRSLVVLTVMGASLLVVAVAIALQYYFTRGVATDSAVAHYSELADNSGNYVKTVDSRAENLVRILASYPGLVSDHGANPDVRDVFAAILSTNPLLYRLYLGFDNGDLYELINLDSATGVRERYQALPQDRWLEVTVHGEGADRYRQLDFYDKDFQLRYQRREFSKYDATARLWYRQAQAGSVNKTVPYQLHHLQEPGQTYSTRLLRGPAVLAVDIALSSLSEHLASYELGEGGEIFIYHGSGGLVASSLPAQPVPLSLPVTPLQLTAEEQQWVAANPVLRVANETNWAPIDFTVAGKPYGYSIDFLSLIAQMTGLRLEFINGFDWPELTELYREGQLDVLQPVFDSSLTRQTGLVTEPFLTLPYSLMTLPGRAPVTHVEQLRDWVVAIPTGWSIIEELSQHYPYIHILEVASSREVFDAVASGRADAGLDLRPVLQFTERHFSLGSMQYHDNVEFAPQPLTNQLRFAFHPEDRIGRDLFNRVLGEITAAQRQLLMEKWFEDSFSSAVDMGMVPYPKLLELSQQLGAPAMQKVVLKGKEHFVYISRFEQDRSEDEYFAVVVPVESVLRSTLDRLEWTVILTVGLLLLLSPVPWLLAAPIARPIRALSAANDKIRQRAFGDLTVLRSRIREVDELGLSLVAMSEAIQQHETRQIELMDSFLMIIAQAVDDKSQSTAGHCERVPELAIMLAEAAEQSTAAAFADFGFASPAERREFRVAAWLHDCGKITTPEHIIEKGSKLELIYNRLHEIRTRFEVLWRDAEIHYWQQRASLQTDDRDAVAVLDEALRSKRAQLQDDFAFVAAMNIGTESSCAEGFERLRRIARTPWTRHFSKRLGLSLQERRQLPDDPEILPCVETLLQDRPEHLVPRPPTEYEPQLGIKMTVPKYLYNQGELYNLCIERGTLTAEDRFKINEHIISTIRMLEALPLPPELARVPRYASTHHETLIGTGYPRKLTAEDLSIPERIMILADVFEALTAADRPYKSAKPVSEALSILAKMVARRHMDPDVFELFLTSGVYRDYARRFLPPDQLDEIDIEAVLHLARGEIAPQ